MHEDYFHQCQSLAERLGALTGSLLSYAVARAHSSNRELNLEGALLVICIGQDSCKSCWAVTYLKCYSQVLWYVCYCFEIVKRRPCELLPAHENTSMGHWNLGMCIIKHGK